MHITGLVQPLKLLITISHTAKVMPFTNLPSTYYYFGLDLKLCRGHEGHYL